MKPDQISSAVTQIVGDVEISALQVVMIGTAADVTIRRADDGAFFKGIVHFDNPLRVYAGIDNPT